MAQVDDQPVRLAEQLHCGPIVLVADRLRVDEADVPLQEQIGLQGAAAGDDPANESLLPPVPQDGHLRLLASPHHSQDIVCIPAEEHLVSGAGQIGLHLLGDFLHVRAVHTQDHIPQLQRAVFRCAGDHQLSLRLRHGDRAGGAGAGRGQPVDGHLQLVAGGNGCVVVVEPGGQCHQGDSITRLVISLQHGGDELVQTVVPVPLQEVVVGEIVLQGVPHAKQPQQAVSAVAVVHIGVALLL